MFARSPAPGPATSALAKPATWGGFRYRGASTCGARRLWFTALPCGARRLWFTALWVPGIKPGPRGPGTKSGVLVVHPPIAFGIDWIGVGGNTTPPMVRRPTRLDRFSISVGFSSRFELLGHTPIDPKILLSLVASPGGISVKGFTDTRTASL